MPWGRSADLAIVGDKGYFAADGCAYGGLAARDAVLMPGDELTADALRGHTVAGNPHGFAGYILSQMLGRFGLGFEDVTLTNVPIPTAFQGLQSGAIDYAYLTEPWLTRAAQSGQAHLALPAPEVVPGEYFGLLFFGPSILDGNRDLGIRFMRAYANAVSQYEEGRTPANVAILAKRVHLDESLVQAACWPAIRPNLGCRANWRAAFCGLGMGRW